MARLNVEEWDVTTNPHHTDGDHTLIELVAFDSDGEEIAVASISVRLSDDGKRLELIKFEIP